MYPTKSFYLCPARGLPHSRCPFIVICVCAIVFFFLQALLRVAADEQTAVGAEAAGCTGHARDGPGLNRDSAAGADGAAAVPGGWGEAAGAAQRTAGVLAGGRVIDPETGLDAPLHVGIAGGKIAALSEA